ncbi:MAG: Hsp20/alpha crystallin family protein [bacterium]
MTLMKYRPRNLFKSHFNDFFDDFFDSYVNPEEELRNTGWPLVDIEEKEKGFEISAEVPGMTKKDIEIEINNNLLNIKGEKKEESEESEKNYHRKETFEGKFCRTFRLPETIDEEKIKANFENGILKVYVPKSPEKGTKKISIQ